MNWSNDSAQCNYDRTHELVKRFRVIYDRTHELVKRFRVV
jgi:hypothetical protein